VVNITDQELWVIDKFINSRWFRGKFQLKVYWEDQEEEQDNWRDHTVILRETAEWREHLVVGDIPDIKPIIQLCKEYYARHLGALQHDDPPHRQAAPPKNLGSQMTIARMLDLCWGVMKPFCLGPICPTLFSCA
jgi:hypothetical protein